MDCMARSPLLAGIHLRTMQDEVLPIPQLRGRELFDHDVLGSELARNRHQFKVQSIGIIQRPYRNNWAVAR